MIGALLPRPGRSGAGHGAAQGRDGAGARADLPAAEAAVPAPGPAQRLRRRPVHQPGSFTTTRWSSSRTSCRRSCARSWCRCSTAPCRPGTRVALAHRMLSARPPSPAEAVRMLLQSDDPWLKSCGAYAIGALGLKALLPELDALAAVAGPAAAGGGEAGAGEGAGGLERVSDPQPHAARVAPSHTSPKFGPDIAVQAQPRSSPTTPAARWRRRETAGSGALDHGLRTRAPGNRLKSLSAVHNSSMPWSRHSAAMRASWTCGTADASGLERRAQRGPVGARLRQQDRARRLEPCVHLIERVGERRWRAEDLRRA